VGGWLICLQQPCQALRRASLQLDSICMLLLLPQDNWFVLTACLKDMYGVIMEEDSSAKPKCVACRRNNISVVLQKVF
jgi:hypothetical protein